MPDRASRSPIRSRPGPINRRIAPSSKQCTCDQIGLSIYERSGDNAMVMSLAVLRSILIALLLSTGFVAAAVAAEDVAVPEPVQVPNFWDPRARMERPSAADIRAIRFLTTDDFPPFSFRDRR